MEKVEEELVVGDNELITEVQDALIDKAWNM